jgi:hypothetical protein
MAYLKNIQPFMWVEGTKKPKIGTVRFRSKLDSNLNQYSSTVRARYRCANLPDGM